MSSEEKKEIIKQLKEFFSKRPEFINRVSQYGSNSILFVSSVTASMGLAGINLAFLSPHIANVIEGVIANFITEKKISSKNKITDKQFEEL
ncbi:MAG: hypothetical protein J7L03_06595, partial [Caldisericaceae bacterium]|nr:hypothetical protein [Caldisericaceae bacterium]